MPNDEDTRALRPTVQPIRWRVDAVAPGMDCRRVPASPSGQPMAGHLSPLGSKSLAVRVTGSSGFIGTHVVRKLHAACHRVAGLDHIAPKSPLPEGVAFHGCDSRRGELPDRTFDAGGHPAAIAGTRQGLDLKQLNLEALAPEALRAAKILIIAPDGTQQEISLAEALKDGAFLRHGSALPGGSIWQCQPAGYDAG